VTGGAGGVPAAFACLPEIERELERYTAVLAVPENLRAAIRYALLGGGKRLRPVLAWACCVAVGGRGPESLAAGAAVELVHAFSLVHDDLPSMDDDDLRRGMPTLHIHAGEAMAVLAGDAMLALAFGLITEKTSDPGLAAALVRELSAATTGMIAGQVYDTLGGLPAGLSERQRLELIHRNKTGALIRAACRMGAMSVLGPGPDARLDAITRFGELAGLVFQIVDDLLDVESTPEQTGKRTRKDADAGKLTYPRVIGAAASREEVRRLTEDAVAALGILGGPAAPLADLCRYLAARTH
jgi:geranylgeranyl diphosphate synthase type II